MIFGGSGCREEGWLGAIRLEKVHNAFDVCERIDWRGWTACGERAEEHFGVGTDGGRQRGHFTPASLPS